MKWETTFRYSRNNTNSQYMCGESISQGFSNSVMNQCTEIQDSGFAIIREKKIVTVFL